MKSTSVPRRPWLFLFLLWAVFLGSRLRLLPYPQRGGGEGAPPITPTPLPSPRLAQLHPDLFAGYALLFLMLFILTNKVFSPQYLLWLAPLLALASFEGRSERVLFGGFLLTCLLSTLLVPFLFVADLNDPVSLTIPRSIKEPTVRICALQLARNLLFTALTFGVARGLLGRFWRSS